MMYGNASSLLLFLLFHLLSYHFRLLFKNSLLQIFAHFLHED